MIEASSTRIMRRPADTTMTARGDNPSMAELPDTPCYLNGSYSALADARISVLDRGFIFGDGVYEVVPIYGGRPFRLAQHLARLDRSLGEIRIPNPLSHAAWADIVDRLVREHAAQLHQPARALDQLIYIQVTRGVAPRDHAMLPGLVPTVFVMVNPLRLPGEAARTEGVRCITANDFRWKKAHIKSVSLLGAVIARQMSIDADAAETVMFRDDWLSEASASNVWVVKNGVLLGPPRDNLVLEGIRYGLIEELCAQAGIRFELRRISRDEVFSADELLLSSATREILPVTRLDERHIGSGRPGPIYQRLQALYRQAARPTEDTTP